MAFLSSVKLYLTINIGVEAHSQEGFSGENKGYKKPHVLQGTQKEKKMHASVLLLYSSLLYKPVFLFQGEYPFFQNNLCLWDL